jgi:hypothetical protein
MGKLLLSCVDFLMTKYSKNSSWDAHTASRCAVPVLDVHSLPRGKE